MAKEDFKDGATPIDMDDYPHKPGDKLPGGITVISVIKGDEKDTFGGYLVKPVIGVRGIKKLYGEAYVMQCSPFTDREGRNPLRDPESYPDGAIALEVVGPVGEPYAQRVVYRLEGESTSHYMTPEEFLAFAPTAGEAEPSESPSKTGSSADWTAEDDIFITENYLRMSDAQMAEILKVDTASLKAHRLGDLQLKKAPGGGKG